MSRDPSKLFRKKLYSYLAGDIILKDFRHWFIPASWNVSQWASCEVRDLVYDIEFHLIEHENSLTTEDELRERLTRVLGSYIVHIGKAQLGNRPSCSSTQIVTETIPYQGRSLPAQPVPPHGIVSLVACE